MVKWQIDFSFSKAPWGVYRKNTLLFFDDGTSASQRVFFLSFPFFELIFVFARHPYLELNAIFSWVQSFHVIRRQRFSRGKMKRVSLETLEIAMSPARRVTDSKRNGNRKLSFSIARSLLFCLSNAHRSYHTRSINYCR